MEHLRQGKLRLHGDQDILVRKTVWEATAKAWDWLQLQDRKGGRTAVPEWWF